GSLWLLAPIGYVNVVGSLIMAWATDRFRLKQINFVFALALAAHAYGATLLPSPLGFALLILGGGIATSIFQPLAGVTWPRFFGRKHIGAISGFNMSSMVIASALGPTVFIRIAEFTGNYQMPLYLSAVFGVALAFGSFWADNPQRRLAKSEAA
ncbi:MAG: MFS transporter, partial [Planctomycetota bacterium]